MCNEILLDLRGRERRVMNTEKTLKCHCSTQGGKMIVLLLRKISRVKKEASEMRDFLLVYAKGVKVSGMRQIYKQRPGSLPWYCRNPKAKSQGDTARSRKCSFVEVAGFCDKTK